MGTKAKVIAFPRQTPAVDFDTDDAIRLTLELQMGRSARFFSDDELDFIESWGGEDSDDRQISYDKRIIYAYGLETEPGEEPQFTWPKLVAELRRRKAKYFAKPME